jgi:hypothetical protein
MIKGSTDEIHNKLEIHHISVSAGDATVIAIRENVKVKKPDQLILIDAGEKRSDLTTIETYCSKSFDTNSFNYIILSHDHKDHRGGLPKSSLLNDNNTTFIYGACLVSYFDSATIKNSHRVDVSLYKEYQIKLKLGITLTCYCAGGAIPGAEPIKDKFNDENDLSLTWVLEYKGSSDYFRYFTAGDLSGFDDSNYSNVEKPLIEYLYEKPGCLKDKKIDVLKASHHGSQFSSFGYDKDEKGYGNGVVGNENSRFLENINPTDVVIPCNATHQLPFVEFFKRAEKYKVENIYLVNFFERSSNSINKTILAIDYNNWEKCSNIKRVASKNHFTYNNVTTPGHLPVVVICVNDKEYHVNTDNQVKFDAKDKGEKIRKVVQKDLPMKIPSYFFQSSENAPSFFSQIFKLAGVADDNDILEIENLYDHGQLGNRILKSGNKDLTKVAILRDVNKKIHLSEHIKKMLRKDNDGSDTAQKEATQMFVRALKRKREEDEEDEEDDARPKKKTKITPVITPQQDNDDAEDDDVDMRAPLLSRKRRKKLPPKSQTAPQKPSRRRKK